MFLLLLLLFLFSPRISSVSVAGVRRCYAHVRERIKEEEMFVFLKICQALCSFYLHFKIHLFALSPTSKSLDDLNTHDIGGPAGKPN